MGVGDWKKRGRTLSLAWWLGLFWAASTFVHAEQLPIKTYTTADGLVRDSVNRIVRDSRGFLWFCTAEGLSSFDGYRFTNFTTREGLPHRSVRDLIETRNGVYWLATGHGLCRFDPTARHGPTTSTHSPAASRHLPSPSQRFVVYQPGESAEARSITVLYEDRTGMVWLGTHDGVYRLEQTSGEVKFHHVDFGMPSQTVDDQIVEAILEDRQGMLWVATGSGLYRRSPDGRIERYTTQHGLPTNSIKSLLEDREGRLWVGTMSGLCLLVSRPDGSRPVVARVYTTKDGLSNNWVGSLFQSSDGRLWVAAGGLHEFFPEASVKSHFRNYGTAQGLSDTHITTMAEDSAGNLWMGTGGSGAMKMARHGFATFSDADGLNSNWISSVFEDQAGELCATAGKAINRFDGRRFVATVVRLPTRITYLGWGWGQIWLQDRTGEWWMATGQGLCRFPEVRRVEQLARTRPRAVYTTRDGLPLANVFRLYEDLRGDLWISTISNMRNGLTRWERATETFYDYTEKDWNAPPGILATAFCEDRAGSLWIGSNASTLLRYRAGRFTRFTPSEGLPAGWIRALHVDRSGRLWIATSEGLGRLDDPTAERPGFITYTMAEGLSSNSVSCIVEDQAGNLYVGTGHGLDRLSVQTGRIRHYTAADGLAIGEIAVAFRDRKGALWFGVSRHGLSRLIPAPEVTAPPPPVFITALRVAGVERAVSGLGEREIAELELGAAENQVQIDFVGLSFAMGETLRYQFKLEGADADWSPPSDQRSVNYPNLSPGRYRFRVRAVTADGALSPSPATAAITILPPIWRRGWFMAATALLLGLAIYAAHRYRLRRLLELERVRTRIATDLHDDIGASLSRMAVLSEVVKQQIAESHPEPGALAANIAETARGLMETMSEIVWSIDPRRDDLNSLIRRVCTFAADALEARGIAWDFQAPPEPEKLKLTPDQRRHIYLIFKEAVNNIIRHAWATSVRFTLQIDHNQLLAEIHDNGRGFAAPLAPPSKSARHGYGLESMQARAAQLGGNLHIDSALGQGTRLRLRIPL